MRDINEYIPKCCDTCTHYVYGCNELDCLLYSHYELDGCVASEYEKAINQAITDDRKKFAEWLEENEFIKEYNWTLDEYETISADIIIAMYKEEQKNEKTDEQSNIVL